MTTIAEEATQMLHNLFTFILSLFTRPAPSQEFLASFATPRRRQSDWAKPECCGHPTGHWSTCHSEEAYLEDAGGDALTAQVAMAIQEIRMGRVPLSTLIEVRATIDAALTTVSDRFRMAQEWSDTLPTPIYVPTGAEFDAAEAVAQNLSQPAKPVRTSRNVRVYSLAEDCGVSSKFLRGVLDQHFGIFTKSPSSTVTPEQAAEVREFFATHADA